MKIFLAVTDLDAISNLIESHCSRRHLNTTGKTTATAHLGVALADLGYDVLLVDLAGNLMT